MLQSELLIGMHSFASSIAGYKHWDYRFIGAWPDRPMLPLKASEKYLQDFIWRSASLVYWSSYNVHLLLICKDAILNSSAIYNPKRQNKSWIYWYLIIGIMQACWISMLTSLRRESWIGLSCATVMCLQFSSFSNPFQVLFTALCLIEPASPCSGIPSQTRVQGSIGKYAVAWALSAISDPVAAQDPTAWISRPVKWWRDPSSQR